MHIEEDNGNGKLKQEDITLVGNVPSDEVSADDLRDPRLVPLLRIARAERLTALGRA